MVSRFRSPGQRRPAPAVADRAPPYDGRVHALVSPEDLTEEDAHRRVRILLALATCMATKG